MRIRTKNKSKLEISIKKALTAQKKKFIGIKKDFSVKIQVDR